MNTQTPIEYERTASADSRQAVYLAVCRSGIHEWQAMSEIPPQQREPLAGIGSNAEREGQTRALPPAQRSSPKPRPHPAAEAVPQPYPSAAVRRPPRQANSGLYLPWWSLLIMIGTVAVIALGLLFILTELNTPEFLGNQTPTIQMVTSMPTLDPNFVYGVNTQLPNLNVATAIPQALPSPTVALPTPIPSPSLPPGEFTIGANVQVVGVEGSGLNVRESPGTGLPRFLAYDGEIFVLVDGPQFVGEIEWWHIEDPNDSNRYGWAARNYLMAVTP